jgi:hypothetical protein
VTRGSGFEVKLARQYKLRTILHYPMLVAARFRRTTRTEFAELACDVWSVVPAAYCPGSQRIYISARLFNCVLSNCSKDLLVLFGSATRSGHWAFQQYTFVPFPFADARRYQDPCAPTHVGSLRHSSDIRDTIHRRLRSHVISLPEE